MIYLMSDIHGYSFEKTLMLLKQSGFTANDYLYILGDVIDRGDDGIKMIQWMMEQSNVELILGNHEAMLLSCDFIFEELNDRFLGGLTQKKISLLNTWQLNGAAPTLRGLTALNKEERENILDYIRDAPLYGAITVGEKDYLLTHSGLGHFDERKKMSDYTPDELLWNRPRLDTRYFDDITVIFGHTPTVEYGKQFAGGMIKTDTWINIDAGAACGYNPMLLCLDTMQEFYSEKTET